MRDLIPAERIEKRILLLRGHKVLLDGDLAELYESVADSRERDHMVKRTGIMNSGFSRHGISVITTAKVNAKDK